MRFPSNRTLGKICVYGAFASITGVIYMQYLIEKKVRKSEFFRMAMTYLRENKGAVGLLGEPIKEAGFDMSNKKNHCNADAAHFEVSVKGSVDRGKMYFWATHSPKGWLLNRLDLEVSSQPDKRFLIKKETETIEEKQDIKELPQIDTNQERET